MLPLFPHLRGAALCLWIGSVVSLGACLNSSPGSLSLTILTPAPGASVNEGSSQLFSVLVEDGNTPASQISVSIRSGLQEEDVCTPSLAESGVASCEAVLEVGQHPLRFVASRADGISGNATISFTVLAAPGDDDDSSGDDDDSSGDDDDSSGDDDDSSGDDDDSSGDDDDSSGDDDDSVDPDGDGDGFIPPFDCNDNNSAIHPNATEIPGDEIDQNCDGSELCYVDVDNDGYRPDLLTMTSLDTDCSDGTEATASQPDGDCMDSNPAVHPGITTFSDVDRGDGSFDFNCDGSSEPIYTTQCQGTCITTGLPPLFSPGWFSASAICGDSAAWADNCSCAGLLPGDPCEPLITGQQTQLCR